MIRAEFFHFPASTFSLAGEEGEKQLGGSDPDGATEQLLKRFETQLFSLDVSAYREDLIGKLPMQGFAMSRFPAIQFPEHGALAHRLIYVPKCGKLPSGILSPHRMSLRHITHVDQIILKSWTNPFSPPMIRLTFARGGGNHEGRVAERTAPSLPYPA